MPGFERIPDDELQPAVPRVPSNVHQADLYVVAFNGEHNRDPAIITLPGASLLHGRRNSARSIERDANAIAEQHQLRTCASGRLYLPPEIAAGTMGYGVRLAHRSPKPQWADFTQDEIAPDHDFALELHNYNALVEHLEDRPERNVEIEYLRAFGAQILKQCR